MAGDKPLYVYYCKYSGKHALTTDCNLASVPRRATDHALVLDTQAHLVKLYTTDGGTKLLRRKWVCWPGRRGAGGGVGRGVVDTVQSPVSRRRRPLASHARTRPQERGSGAPAAPQRGQAAGGVPHRARGQVRRRGGAAARGRLRRLCAGTHRTPLGTRS